MGIFPFSVKIQRKSQPVAMGELRSTFMPLDFIKAFLSNSLNSGEDNYLKYYLSVPELQAIINYRARVLASMRVRMRKVESKDEIEKHPILNLIQNPNPLQSFSEYVKQYSIGRDIFGNSFIHLVFGLNVEKTQAIYNLPALHSEIIPVNKNIIPYNQTNASEIIKEYQFKFNSGTITYQPDEIIHINDNQIQVEGNKWLKGTSKIMPLTQVCENIKTAYEARGILQGNSPMGIITNKSTDGQGSVPMIPGEKEQIQLDLKRYGLKKEKYQFLVTSANLDWTSMAVNIGGLKLFEEITADQSALADAFSFPVELFQNNVTYANKKEAKKQLYQDSIIPEANEFLQNLSTGLNLIDQGIELYADFSHIPILQDDLEKRSNTWMRAVSALDKSFASQAITIEEYRENLIKIGML